jgi:hypothetical protein
VSGWAGVIAPMVSAAGTGCGPAEAGAGAVGGRSEDDGTGEGSGGDMIGSPGATGSTYVGGSMVAGWDGSTAGCDDTGGSVGGGKIGDDANGAGEGEGEGEGKGADSGSAGTCAVGAATKPQLGQIPAPLSSTMKSRPHRAHRICCTRKLDSLHRQTAASGQRRPPAHRYRGHASRLLVQRQARRMDAMPGISATAARHARCSQAVLCSLAARHAPAPEQNQVYT